jgi:hypothetical protein
MIPDHDELDPLGDFTFTFWFNPTSYAQTVGQILNKYSAGMNNEGGWAAQFDPKRLYLSAYNGFVGTSNIPLNTWSFDAIVFTKSSNSRVIYFNGQVDAFGTSSLLIKNN